MWAFARPLRGNGLGCLSFSPRSMQLEETCYINNSSFFLLFFQDEKHGVPIAGAACPFGRGGGGGVLGEEAQIEEVPLVLLTIAANLSLI